MRTGDPSAAVRMTNLEPMKPPRSPSATMRDSARISPRISSNETSLVLSVKVGSASGDSRSSTCTPPVNVPRWTPPLGASSSPCSARSRISCAVLGSIRRRSAPCTLIQPGPRSSGAGSSVSARYCCFRRPCSSAMRTQPPRSSVGSGSAALVVVLLVLGSPSDARSATVTIPDRPRANRPTATTVLVLMGLVRQNPRCDRPIHESRRDHPELPARFPPVPGPPSRHRRGRRKIR